MLLEDDGTHAFDRRHRHRPRDHVRHREPFLNAVYDRIENDFVRLRPIRRLHRERGFEIFVIRLHLGFRKKGLDRCRRRRIVMLRMWDIKGFGSRVRHFLCHREGLRDFHPLREIADFREGDGGIYGRSEIPLLERGMDLRGVELPLRIENVVRFVVFAQEIPRPFGRHF